VLTARFEDHSERVIAMLNRKLAAAIGAAAEDLADAYRAGLQFSQAPPHSRVGEIPHRYFGHRPGGFGPVFGAGEPNNTQESGFSATQTDYLSTYIEGGADDVFGIVNGYVGFLPSHVTTREQNYLLEHDQRGRPWVIPLYRSAKSEMARVAKSAFEGTN